MVSTNSCDLVVEGKIFLGSEIVELALVCIQGDKIIWSGPQKSAPKCKSTKHIVHKNGFVVPGYVDLHVHGAGGADVVDGTPQALETISRVHLAHGTVAFCPTVLTSSKDVMLKAIDVICEAAKKQEKGARIIGANIEGPFLNPKYVGAQPKEHLKLPDIGLLEEFLSAGGDSIKIITLAPELPWAMKLIERIIEKGIVASIGHSNATYEEAKRAVDAGCTLVTHAFNAMRPLHHREPGVLGVALEDDRVVTEVIADGIHVSAPMLKLLAREKTCKALALVTDCTAALGALQGKARLGNQSVYVKDNAVRLSDGTLAGSSLTLDRAVANMVAFGAFTPKQAFYSASITPLRFLGSSYKGGLETGSFADFLLLDDQLCVEKVFLGGQEI